MPDSVAAPRPPGLQQKKNAHACYHCGDPCLSRHILLDDHVFCCEGCKLVYEILQKNGLCDYYTLQSHPGLSRIKAVRSDKFAYLDDAAIASRLYDFTDGNNTVITLYIPAIHCSSCMWLLENLYRMDAGVSDSRLNFTAKEVTIRFRQEKTSIRKIVELLTTIGYEPYISLEQTGSKKKNSYNRKRLYRLGVAGFCAGNIMLMSFPEYLSGSSGIDQGHILMFRLLNLTLAIPVFFYSASEFFTSAWAGIRGKMLNIDAPIALALIITFARSIYEIAAGIGGGYLDSMAGIVLFMLAGRIVQERTWHALSFHRDYRAYFPVAVKVVNPDGTFASRGLQELKAQDEVIIHHEEIIPADGVLVEGNAQIDYSFVTGESNPVTVPAGATVYAGGKQIGSAIHVSITKPVASGYLTSLWNHHAFAGDKAEHNDRRSVMHVMSRYFTIVLLSLASLVALYWWFVAPANILPAVSAMLIVACPCALLLAVTYTNGNLLRLLSNNGLYLRDATVIEQLGNINQIVFDKTGTLTRAGSRLHTAGHTLSPEEKAMVYHCAIHSRHPYSKALADWAGVVPAMSVAAWEEKAGFGVSAVIDNHRIRIGSASWTGVVQAEDKPGFFVRIDDRITAFYLYAGLREGVEEMILHLQETYQLSLISGDNNREKESLQQLFGKDNELLFEQRPADKLQYIVQLQQQGKKVLMIGDGLNDAGALRQSNAGITLADDINNFTPSCDAILDAKQFNRFPVLLRLAASGKKIIRLCFFVSILYNVVGLTIAAQAKMSPLIAAILMPASTLTIVLLTTGVGSLLARRLGLKLTVSKQDSRTA